jgi:hypothetical protein
MISLGHKLWSVHFVHFCNYTEKTNILQWTLSTNNILFFTHHITSLLQIECLHSAHLLTDSLSLTVATTGSGHYHNQLLLKIGHQVHSNAISYLSKCYQSDCTPFCHQNLICLYKCCDMGAFYSDKYFDVAEFTTLTTLSLTSCM